MAKGGSIKKLVLNGLPRTLSSDNDPTFTEGGSLITEKQDTTGKPFFLVDNISGILSGLEERAGHAEMKTLTAAAKKCADEGPVSCNVTMPDGTVYSAMGGAMIIFDDAPGGIMTIREGKIAYSVHPAKGKWI